MFFFVHLFGEKLLVNIELDWSKDVRPMPCITRIAVIGFILFFFAVLRGIAFLYYSHGFKLLLVAKLGLFGELTISYYLLFSFCPSC